MTDRIKAIVEKSSTDIVRYPIVKAIVNRDGSRAIDTAQITIPAGVRVAVNDTVSYIQDDVSLEYLVALWNFQGSTRDESGFHHDGTTQGSYINPEGTGNSKAYRTNYGLNFTTAGQEITVTDNNMSSDKTDASIDFRQQFDVIINFKSMDDGSASPTNTTQILFSKYNGTNGVEIGIKQVSSKWVIYAKLDSTTFTGNGTLYGVNTALGKIDHDALAATRCIRFYRDHESKVRLTLDDMEDGSNCTQTVQPVTNSRVSTALKIGSDRLGADDFKGFIFQIRVYCGGCLTDEDIQILQSAGAQQMTQKVSGNVWKRKDKLKSVMVDIKSRSRSILDSEITLDIINDDVQDASTGKPASHTKNLFDGGQGISDILQTIIKYVDPDFAYLKSPAISAQTELSYGSDDGKYLAVGKFVRNVELLSILANRSFMTFPTKTFVWEENSDGTSDLDSGYTFPDSEYQIYNRGEDDTKIINDLELYGDLQFQYKETNFGALSSVTAGTPLTTKFLFPPLNVTLVQGASNYASGGGNGLPIPAGKYDIDFNERTLTFSATSWTNPNSVTNDYIYGKYVYEIRYGMTIAQGGTNTNKRHYKDNDSTSVTTYGRRSAKLYYPQLLTYSDFRQLSQKLLIKVKDAKRRYTIKAPFMINCLRENLQVTLTSEVMLFTNTSGVETLDETLQPIKSIEWRYPECETVIEVGDHIYDLFDSSKITHDTAGQTQSSILKTQSNA
jgi:hypothetical protein